MNVEIGTEAVQFPEKEYINGIFVAVYTQTCCIRTHTLEFETIISKDDLIFFALVEIGSIFLPLDCSCKQSL